MKKLLAILTFGLLMMSNLYAQDLDTRFSYVPTLRDVQSIESVAFSMRDRATAREYADVWLPIRDSASDIIIMINSGKSVVSTKVINGFQNLLTKLQQEKPAITRLREVEMMRDTANHLLTLMYRIENDLD